MTELATGVASARETPGEPSPQAPTPPSVAFLSYSTGEFDVRSMRMARSAIAAGWTVTVYARLEPGHPDIEQRDGYRVVRVPAIWRLAIPGLRSGGRIRVRTALAEAALLRSVSAQRDETKTWPIAESRVPQPAGIPLRVARFLAGPLRPTLGRWLRRLRVFPLSPLGWAVALDDVATPADVWHGMWAGSLPALDRQRRRLGGATVYDSRDVFMLSRDWARLEWPLRPILAAAERRWARRADLVLTVNEAYADLLVRRLGVPRPAVVMNCPETWTPPSIQPDLIRTALGLMPETAIVLYQGQLISDRGIEQAMDAVVQVPSAALVLLGYGKLVKPLQALAAAPPYLGKVYLLPAVRPDDLLAWTASADISIMPIQPTSVNHRYTTPQKLFESLAVGVPVVASDLPGMREIVEKTGAGVVCDPTSPDAIATAIRRLVAAPPAERAEFRQRALAAAHETYNWEAQARVLLGVYADLLRSSARAR